LTSQTGPIAVYGATGYTGRLVARELRRRELDLVLSGRDAGKLRALAGELGGDVPVREAGIGDRDALRHAIGDCAAVINCAGPFVQLGEPVVRAAVETGTHYVDTTGEQPFMKLVVDRYDEPARAAEIAVLTGMGFDYVPGDLIARLVCEGHEPVDEFVTAYAVSDFGATRGTLRSGLGMMKGDDLVYRDGDWQPAGSGPLRAHVVFPPPVGRQPVGRYPSGEQITVPRHSQVRNVVSRIAYGTMAPGPLGELMGPMTPALGLALRTPLRGALDAAIAALPEGPPEEARRAARFLIVAHARGEDGSEGHGVVRGSDVYGLTAVTTVHGASLLAAEGYDRSGALSPASAFEPVPFLNFLTDHGLSWELT
jgi:short subunit dehydrogenase-like uncharacterized protein